MTALSGFLAGNVISVIFPPETTVTSSTATGLSSIQSNIMAAQAFFAVGMAMFGALFYIYTSVKQKQEESHPFDASQFWAGLLFRLGQSVLFTVVIFIVIQSNEIFPSVPFTMASLPVIALFLGMYVKSGEKLLDGFGKRVFAAVQALVGAVEPPKNKDGK